MDTPNVSGSVEKLRNAAERGDPEAQWKLGVCYDEGRGIPEDLAQSIFWFRRAAEQGHSDAQLSLSIACKYGRGVAKDQDEANRWLRLAAESGDPRAQSLLGLGLLIGKGIEENKAEAFRWLQKAAAQGDEEVGYLVGICYAYGWGTEKNIDEARKRLRLAAQQDYPGAKFYLRHLFFQKYSIIKWRNVTITILGWAFLVFYGIHFPITINYRAVAAFFGIFAAIGIVSLGIIAATKILGMKVFDDADAEFTAEQMFSELKKRPWEFFLIPAEDGFFLLPLLYAGINPVSAAVAAFLFGLAHYPFFPGLTCIPKGVAYFFVALFILPYGIWSVVLGHLVVDAVIFIGGLVVSVEGKPTWQRLSKVLQTR